MALVSFVLLARHQLTLSFLTVNLLFTQAYDPHQKEVVWNLVTHPRWYLTHLPSLMNGAHRLPIGGVGLPLALQSTSGILWSLSVEEYFYLLWAPIVLRCSKSAIVSIGAGICAGEMLLRWVENTPRAYFGLAYRFDALVYGAFLALFLEWWRYHEGPRWSQWLLWAVLGAASVGLVSILWSISPLLGRDPRGSPLLMVFGLPFFSLAIAAAMGLLIVQAQGMQFISTVLRSRIFQSIGAVSYAMYLTHLAAAGVVRRLANVADPYSQTLIQGLSATILTFAIAKLSWLYLEGPLLRWKDIRFPNQPHPPMATGPGE